MLNVTESCLRLICCNEMNIFIYYNTYITVEQYIPIKIMFLIRNKQL